MSTVQLLATHERHLYRQLMPAKPLPDALIQDAKRLRAAFLAYQDRLRDERLPYSQESIAEKLGFNQSALSQYLHGRIPLNWSALTSFCKLIGVQPEAISPRLVAEESSRAMLLGNPTARQTTEPTETLQMKKSKSEEESLLDEADMERFKRLKKSAQLLVRHAAIEKLEELEAEMGENNSLAFGKRAV